MRIELIWVQRMMEWMRRKVYLETMVPSAKNRIVKRGQVYRCDFGQGIGSEMQKERPAVIIQNDIGNIHSSNTIVLPITHNQRMAPCIVTIEPQWDTNGELIVDGQVNASNIMCISKARLGNYITVLSSAEMRKVDEAIAKSVGIISYYSGIKKKLENKMQYITRLKEERNRAQDDLKKMEEVLNNEKKINS
ncbi:MAG: type II toxin-antitoxin system PemK/MazF family toxin [Firmicutes bacterium]|nr:type II toxin-antitoxin system PemK/MazF family toxin [Bacillota bacterium]